MQALQVRRITQLLIYKHHLGEHFFFQSVRTNVYLWWFSIVSSTIVRLAHPNITSSRRSRCSYVRLPISNPKNVYFKTENPILSKFGIPISIRLSVGVGRLFTSKSGLSYEISIIETGRPNALTVTIWHWGLLVHVLILSCYCRGDGLSVKQA